MLFSFNMLVLFIILVTAWTEYYVCGGKETNFSKCRALEKSTSILTMVENIGQVTWTVVVTNIREFFITCIHFPIHFFHLDDLSIFVSMISEVD